MTSTGHFPLIDLLRGFAAISVLTLHVIALSNWTAFPTRGPLAWFRVGALGVDLFFVISGFVIAHSAFSSFERRKFGFVWPYLKHRLFRIVPLFYLTLAVFLCVEPSLLSSGVFLDRFISHVLFYFTFQFDRFSSINGPNWSVGIEMQFYLLMAILTPVLFRIRSQLVAIAVFVLVSIAIAGAWRYFGNSIIAKDGNEFRNYRVFVVTTQLPGHLDEFALGICVAFFVRSRIFERVCGNVVWCILLAAAFAPLFYLSIILYGGVISAEFSITVRGRLRSDLCVGRAHRLLNLLAAVDQGDQMAGLSRRRQLWHLPLALTCHLDTEEIWALPAAHARKHSRFFRLIGRFELAFLRSTAAEDRQI